MRYVLLVVIFMMGIVGCSLLRMTGLMKDIPKSTVVPEYAQRAEPYGPVPVPEGYAAAIAWVNAVQKTMSVTSGYVMLYTLELYGVKNNGDRILLARDDYTGSSYAGGVFRRLPWFGAQLQNIPSAENFLIQNGGLYIPTGARPDCVYHPWGNQWPRVALPSDVVSVVAIADLQCFGDACAQVGADFWPGTGTETTNTAAPSENQEAGASRWVAASDGRVQLELGK